MESNIDFLKLVNLNRHKYFLNILSFLNEEKSSFINLFPKIREFYFKKLKNKVRKYIFTDKKFVEYQYCDPNFLYDVEKYIMKNFKFNHFFTNKEVYDTIIALIFSKIFKKSSIVFSTLFVDYKEESKFISLFSKYLEKNDKIKVLVLSFYLLNLQTSKILCSILNGLPKLKHLSLKFQTFTVEGIENLKNISIKLKFLDISNCQLKMYGISKLIPLLTNLVSLKSLDLSHNFFAEKSCKILCDFLKNSHNIINLNLSHNYFNNYDLKILCESIQKNSSLKTLSLRNNSVSSEGVKHIFDLIKTNIFLSYLDLSESKVTTKEIDFILESIKENKYLKKLILNKNRIGDEGFIKLAGIKNKKIYIELKHNNITDTGPNVVMDSIDNKFFNKKLAFRISENNITDNVIRRIMSNTKYSIYLKLE